MPCQPEAHLVILDCRPVEDSVLVGEEAADPPRVVRIPTLYGGEHGPDIEFVAENAGLTAEEVVRAHSGVDYLVYMMGFTPGFPYLGRLPERRATPRLSAPRAETPGSLLSSAVLAQFPG